MEKNKKDKPEQAPGAEPEPEKGKEQEAGQPTPAPAAAESTGAEEKPKEQKEGESPARDKPEEEGGDAEKPDGEKEDPAEEKPTEEKPPEPKAEGESETARLTAELLAARSQLAAYAAGVTPDMIQDAVTLATAEAQAAGKVTEEAVAKAMAAVLKRHPEWKTEGGKKKSGGFKLGADPDASGKPKSAKADGGNNKKRWNRFK